MKLRRTRWAGHVVHIEEVHTGYWSENVKGRGYIWKPRLRIESSGELLWTRKWSFRYYGSYEIFGRGERLPASEKWVCSITITCQVLTSVGKNQNIWFLRALTNTESDCSILFFYMYSGEQKWQFCSSFTITARIPQISCRPVQLQQMSIVFPTNPSVSPLTTGHRFIPMFAELHNKDVLDSWVLELPFQAKLI